jgi:hypothetical protein
LDNGTGIWRINPLIKKIQLTQKTKTKMKKIIVMSGLMALVALAIPAQNTNLVLLPGKLAVFRGGDGVFTFSDRRFPAFIDEYDPAITNQTGPMLTVALPTNGVNSMWFNLHAGSEGQGITRSADRQFIAVTGYHGGFDQCDRHTLFFERLHPRFRPG